MDDRTLLEKAAKAAGYKLGWAVDYAGTGIDGEMPYLEPSGDEWNSLDDDGDCFRLETTLDLNVAWYSLSVVVRPPVGEIVRVEFSEHDGDKNKARRRASTIAAAAMADKEGE